MTIKKHTMKYTMREAKRHMANCREGDLQFISQRSNLPNTEGASRRLSITPKKKMSKQFKEQKYK